jgi:hypothetical protein
MLAVPRAMMTTLPWKPLTKVDLQMGVDFATRSDLMVNQRDTKRVIHLVVLFESIFMN